jgi:hypothetical protein
MHPQSHFATSNHFSFFFSDFATPMQLANLFIPETENWGKTGGFSAILCAQRLRSDHLHSRSLELIVDIDVPLGSSNALVPS